MIGAGPKNTRVTFQSPTAVRDTQGGQAVTFAAAVSDVWAEVGLTPNAEQLLATQVTAVATTTVRTWYQSSLSSVGVGWRVLVGSRVLEIQGIDDPGQRHAELVFLCREVQA